MEMLETDDERKGRKEETNRGKLHKIYLSRAIQNNFLTIDGVNSLDIVALLLCVGGEVLMHHNSNPYC